MGRDFEAQASSIPPSKPNLSHPSGSKHGGHDYEGALYESTKHPLRARMKLVFYSVNRLIRHSQEGRLCNGSYTAKLLFHQSLHCSLTTWWLSLLPNPRCTMTTGQWLHCTLLTLGIHYPRGLCRNLATRHLVGNYTVTTWAATRYPITHNHHVGIRVAQIHGFVAFH